MIATVACGLYISWNGPLLISAATRLQGIFFWDLVIYLIEGMLFLLTGFQMRSLLEKSKAFPLGDILFAVGLVVVIIVVARFAWVYPATYLPRFLSKRLRDARPLPVLAHGVRDRLHRRARRGVARGRAGAAYALANGDPFPNRDLILFVTFSVILITLVGTGLGLPPLVRWLGVAQDGRSEHSPSTKPRSPHAARRSTPRCSRSMP